jgi:hypothetical protein
MNESELTAEVAGNKISLKNMSLNTMATVITLILIILLIYILYMHQQDSKEGNREFVSALREQTTAIRDGTSAQREQTCILKFSEQERKMNADWCKQVSGAR